MIKGEKYAAIIGLNPSKGARSPKLWNKAYERLNQKTRMVCIDINDETKVAAKIKNLEEDPNFIGGCIAFPYKETIFHCLGNHKIETTSRPIGAINCLYRSENNYLMGTNTDGSAALSSFLNMIHEEKTPKSILIAGLGGAGKAVASFFSSHCLSKGIKLYCVSRKNHEEFANQIKAKWIPWNNLENSLKKVDAFVNCTLIGTGELINSSPIDISQNNLNLKFIYDIVYDPPATPLINYAKSKDILFKNGLEMNLLQAVKAFKLVNNLKTDEAEITKLMS